MGIVVIGDVFIDVKGYSTAPFIPGGRNAGEIQQIHGGVGRKQRSTEGVIPRIFQKQSSWKPVQRC